MRPVAQYVFNLALALDQFVNAILFGDPDESISGRCGRALASGRPKWFVHRLSRVVDWIFRTFFGETDHVKNAVEQDERPHEKELWSWKTKEGIIDEYDSSSRSA